MKYNAENNKWLKIDGINAYHFIHIFTNVPIFFDFNSINNIHYIRNGNTSLRNICGHYYLTHTRGINLKKKIKYRKKQNEMRINLKKEKKEQE